jgi:hypothetical protein
MNINKVQNKISKNLEFSELEQSINNFSDNNILKLSGKNKVNAKKGQIKDISQNSKSINVLEIEFTVQLPSKDSIYGSNIILNAPINIFRFIGSYSPIKKQIFELEFKSPSNIYDKNGNFINQNADIKDLDLRKLFYNLATNRYNNVILIESSGEHDLSMDETSPINFILVRNMDGKINIKSRNPIIVVSFNSNFKLKYTYENINIKEYSELKLIYNDSQIKDCPKESCPVCNKEECPKQSCPVCNKECPKQSCPVCNKEDCPKQSCPECPSNTGWIIATLILLLFAIVLFILKMRKSKKYLEN